MKLYPHHESTIENIRKEFISDEKVLAILVGGSIAHGHARDNSDVDIVFVLTDKEDKKIGRTFS
ncbi:MAG: nucleotidyltransferase domain-containing protein [Spirochaetes bacterium]|nr:nucleotidyltransferase domain-containing protein [Spirochaetota bacterium]